ncbi:MAG: lipoprotein-releasing system ATP-binding protein LolD [Desulfuromonas sp.]|nr:MAG: lipoprotein-releasing system ATP-binding protein LolD [Desulfuromonas sp.]
MIEVRNLNKSFQTTGGELSVLRHLNLTVNRGERVSVVGRSGAGKTTLMHILGGIDRPTSGQVLFSGEDVFALQGDRLDAFRNRSVGFIFQFHQLLPEFTAVENVMMPLLIGRVARKEATRQAEALLSEVGLTDRLTHKPGALSGGEQQRVAIARALVRDPKLLLADEPTGNLDRRTSNEIMTLLDRLHRERGLTMVIVTHNEHLASSLDRTLRMDDGQLVNDCLN